MIINEMVKWLITILMFPMVLYVSYSTEWIKGNAGTVSYKEFKQIVITVLFSALYLLVAYLLILSLMYLLKQNQLMSESMDIKLLLLQFGAYVVVGMLVMFMDLRREREYNPPRFALQVFVLWVIASVIFHASRIDFIVPVQSGVSSLKQLAKTL